jgi:hypothetical protein
MSNVTLQQIEAKHAEIAALIDKFKQQKAAEWLVLPERSIMLLPGELYAGIMLGDDGKPSHHLVLMPDRAESVTWDQAVEFAKRVGGELPSRREQSLLFANLKDQFEAAWYWSGEQHESDGSFAWYQYFIDGNQYSNHKSYEGRAVAVRRFPA